jgi:hypothetical protein
VIRRQRSRNLHRSSSLVAVHSVGACGDVAIERATNWIVEGGNRAHIISRRRTHALILRHRLIGKTGLGQARRGVDGGALQLKVTIHF